MSRAFFVNDSFPKIPQKPLTTKDNGPVLSTN